MMRQRRGEMRTTLMIASFVVGCVVLCRGEDNVGCSFSGDLCEDRIEFCYDDLAFGRCLPIFRDPDKEQLYRYTLGKDELKVLEEEIERLLQLGYQWSNTLTQCVVKQLLDAFRHGGVYDERLCAHWADHNMPAVPPGDEPRDEVGPDMDPHNVAIVRFRPSSGNAHPDFADEIYYPPITDENIMEREIVMGEPSAMEMQPRFPQLAGTGLMKKSENFGHHQPPQLPPSGIFSPLYNTPDKFRVGYESRDAATPLLRNYFQQPIITYEKEQPVDVQLNRALEANSYEPDQWQEASNQPVARVYAPQNALPEDFSTAEDFRQALEDARERQEFLLQRNEEGGFERDYNTPDNFRAGLETRDEVDVPGITLEDLLTASRYSNEIPVVDSSRSDEGKVRLSPKLGRLENLLYASPTEDGEEDTEEKTDKAYTEGGLVFLPSQEKGNRDVSSGFGALLGLGFKRPERLDVKKPGPMFTVMNLAEQHHQKMEDELTSQPGKPLAEDRPVGPGDFSSSSGGDKQQKSKKLTDGTRPTLDAGQYDVVDTTYAYIGFKDSITSWHEGRNIMINVALLLGLPPGTLSHSRVDRNEVTFKVEPNSLKMNSSEVAKRIEGIKDELKQRTGVVVTSAGIGDKTKLPTVISLAPDQDQELWMAGFLLAGVFGSVVIAGTALFFIRRQAKTRDKLRGLGGPDEAVAGDYQDLCRARMAGKTAPEKAEPVGHRISSLSRESESNNSPSTRSSTSSWSEEPALTNMDISTGHMVLSYMEDHLKNKDRLDQEWVALCAYEAEPCATTQALKPDNIAKNRYADILPYDHSRVVLNDLANISGADYINASTITDHDPRSPAYIATQGPLPQTAPHFWQLVWEQGSVVMVMLTRLTEDGNAMCHRYWPEEGSELYHIYEVHLVSEHIWCDDYLVRSFYLKNLKTGETRTVTQFHFLSWPDNGVPTSTKALLEFRRKVNKSYRGRSCPIVVHCSDGVARTGTYCLIDMVLNRMAKGAKEIDIAATLEHIRDQRAGMVKTREQFEFVLMAVAEEVNAILKALPPAQQQPPVVPVTQAGP